MDISYQVPHIFWARLLLSHISLENNRYRHTVGPVSWGPYNDYPRNDNQIRINQGSGEEQEYESITDCSGFINALLEKAYYLPNNWLGTPRPYASTYYQAIEEGKFFIAVPNIKDVKVGDFIALKYPKEMDNTGHIAVINDIPMYKSTPTAPIVNGTNQWLVEIIDQSTGHSQYNDTRFNNQAGLGIGYMRIYTNLIGEIIGYTWSNHPNSKFITPEERGIIIGRLNLGPDY